MSDLQLWDFYLGTQARVRNSHGKRAISVRAIEVLLYIDDKTSVAFSLSFSIFEIFMLIVSSILQRASVS